MLRQMIMLIGNLTIEQIEEEYCKDKKKEKGLKQIFFFIFIKNINIIYYKYGGQYD